MPRPTESIILQNYTLDLLLLPDGVRTVAKKTISITTAANAHATTINVTGASGDDYEIKAGTSVSFASATGATSRQQVLFTADVEIGATGVAASVSPLFKAIAANATASVLPGSIPLFGVQSFDLQSQETTVDVTNVQSGSGTESAMVRFNRTIAVNGVALIGDVALDNIIKRLTFNTTFANREVYAIATYPTGEKYEGAAKIMGYTSPGNQNEVARYQFNLQFQGDSFIYTPANPSLTAS